MSEQTPRILIVDDDPIVAESIAEFLAEHGYDTAAARSGPEALTAIDDARCGVGRAPRPFAVLVCEPIISNHSRTSMSEMTKN